MHSYATDATFMGDLRRFTPSASTWTDLSGSSVLNCPSARAYHRLASTGEDVYIFGGSSDEGNFPSSCKGWVRKMSCSPKCNQDSIKPGLKLVDADLKYISFLLEVLNALLLSSGSVK